MDNELIVLIIGLGACVVVPCVIAWLVYRVKINRMNKRAEIILAAIEKNANLDVEEFMKKMAPPQMSEAEKLNRMLRRGCVFSFLGLAFLGLCVWVFYYGASQQAVGPLGFFFITCMGTGLSYLIAYKVRKK